MGKVCVCGGGGGGRLRVLLSRLKGRVCTSRTGHRREMEDRRWEFNINCRITL